GSEPYRRAADADDGSSSPVTSGSTVTSRSTVTSGTSGGGSCVANETRCAGSQAVDLCIEGTFETVPCSEFCDYFGITALGCSGSQCECGEPTNGLCLQGMSNFCACMEAADTPCTDQRVSDYYIACHQSADEGYFACWGSYVVDTLEDCAAVANTYD